MGYEKVYFESDNQQLVLAVRGCSQDLTEFGSTVAACQRVLQAHPYYTVTWIRRHRNGFAHELARWSRNLVSTLSGESPPDDFAIILNEMCFDLMH
ncbi:hypothetical protein LINGRAPRIM_LOCUS623 [Linum grandiflorum]